MRILVSESAFSDLEEIKKYYKKQGLSHIGNQFVVSILEHVQTLKDNPDIGRTVPEFANENVRELIHPPFRIVYLREAKSIHIIRIWRSERLMKMPEST